MDLTAAARVTEVLLGFGLAIQTERTDTGYWCRIIGATTVVIGIGGSFCDALSSAVVRWRVLN
jgi:hypothetical protein